MKNKIIITAITASFLFINAATVQDVYVCLPCGNSCDAITSNSPGTCTHCNMQMVKKATVVFDTVLPAQLYSHIKKAGSDNVILLDVRTPEEFNGTATEKFGKLKNAVNIPIQQLQQRLNELEPYKQKEIIVYCSHSHRSPQASYLLTQNGFAKVTNMQRGMYIWKMEVKDIESNELLYVSQE